VTKRRVTRFVTLELELVTLSLELELELELELVRRVSHPAGPALAIAPGTRAGVTRHTLLQIFQPRFLVARLVQRIAGLIASPAFDSLFA
jgi:hypothetical protein